MVNLGFCFKVMLKTVFHNQKTIPKLCFIEKAAIKLLLTLWWALYCFTPVFPLSAHQATLSADFTVITLSIGTEILEQI